MKLNQLRLNETIPDGYRLQVIDKIEHLNKRIENIKEKNGLNQRTVVCYELKWLLGNYKYTTINVSGMLNDIKRIKNLEDVIDFFEHIEDWKHFLEKD